MDLMEFQATVKRHRWGLLFDEFRAAGWRPLRVDPLTGERSEKGVWVMRFTGYGDEEALRFARRCKTVRIKKRFADRRRD